MVAAGMLCAAAFRACCVGCAIWVLPSSHLLPACRFTPSSSVPSSCTGPSLSLAITPKTCVLEGQAKQVAGAGIRYVVNR